MKTICWSVLLTLWLLCLPALAQPRDLRQKLLRILANKNTVTGVSVIGYAPGDTLSLHGDRRFPMQSVFKFHIALAMLAQIDQGRYTLDQSIEVRKEELLPGLWSPLREAHPAGGRFPIAQLIRYAVAQSDNVACDVLLRLVGGPTAVEDYFKQKGIADIAIRINEETMQSNWDLMFENWTTPKAAGQTLARFYHNTEQLLSPASHRFVWEVMKSTETGQNRLKGRLPKGTVVAHKTGSSGTNKAGITEAVNDIGILFLPNGKYVFLSVFVSHSTENEKTNEKIIADIAKAVWDHYAVERR